jgi:hypothetical protein
MTTHSTTMTLPDHSETFMHTSAQAGEISKGAYRTGWTLSGLVIAFLLFDSVMKFLPLDVIAQSSRELGLPVELAPTLGVVLLICTILYAWPRTAVLGAILLTGYMGGAIVTHLRVGNPLFTHLLFGVYLGLMVWGGLYLRDPRIRALIPWRRG